MTTTESTALAVREMSLAEIGRRIDLNKASGWGLQEASPAQLNALALYCQKWQLLPGEEVTLYGGAIWKTIDGHVTLMRRDAEYAGYSQRPLTREEKEAWGDDPEDIVVETTIRTKTMGEIKAYGRVSAAERKGEYVKGVRHNPVAQHHAAEMARKRSLARGHRLAFGMSSYVDDEEVEETARVVIQERTEPARVAAGAAQYDATIRPNYDEDLPMHIAAPVVGSAPTSAAEPEDADLLQAARERNESACKEAEEIGVKGVKQLRWAKTDAIEDIERKTFEAEERTRSRNNEIDADLAAQGSGQAAFS